MELFKFGAALGVVLAAGLVFAAPADAETKSKLNLTGKFDTAASKKAWPRLQGAMNRPMAELVDKATQFDPDAVLEYGLALELGRPAETLSERQAKRVQSAFAAFLNANTDLRDNVTLTGHEEALLKEPDFWIILAKNLARHERQQAFNAGGTLSTDGGFTPGGALSFSSIDWDDGEFSQGNYDLSGPAVLGRYMVYASQSCAMYARAFDQMKKVQLIDAAALPKLTPDELANDRKEAVRIYRLTAHLGPQACGGQEMFDTVSAFADNYLGQLGAYPNDPKLTLASLDKAADESPKP
ncbi:MAG TPA: hypothetical protein VG839_00410 [Asticcacaulis sp.]|nr:hypothetical protein [Asticcacaulis sp.]